MNEAIGEKRTYLCARANKLDAITADKDKPINRSTHLNITASGGVFN